MRREHQETIDVVQWVRFDSETAILRRVIFADKKSGLMLTFAEGSEGDALRERAIDYGFQTVPNQREVVYRPPSPSLFTASMVADRLDGEVFMIPRDELTAVPWTLDCPPLEATDDVLVDQSEFTQVEREIGLNFRGERVLQMRDGSRIKQVTDSEGQTAPQTETKESNPAEFLRAIDESQLPQIAAGLLKMAEQGNISKEDLSSIANDACEPLGRSSPSLDANAVEETVRVELLRQLIATVVTDGGSRENYHRVMQLADRIAEAVKEPQEIQGLAPTPGFMVFLRRLTLGAREIEYSGNSRLELAAPTLRSEGTATYQLLDLTVAAKDGAAERGANVLANRSESGISILLTKGSADENDVAAVRQAVGRAYALEAVAEISPLVADGKHDGSPITAFIVGERRPKAEASLPQAARRTFMVETWDDLDKLHTELLRTRRRIAEWHHELSGKARDDHLEDNEEGDTRQRPYVALSSVAEPFTMIPKSLEGAIAKALRRAAIEFKNEGGIDQYVARLLGMTGDELAHKLSAEQVDAVALRQLAAMRGRGFLLADQTGVGKGRSLAAMAGYHLRAGGKVLYFTENAEINIPDVWRDFVAVGAHKEARPCILASRPVTLSKPESNDLLGEVYQTESAASRKQIYESNRWPKDKNLVITNYSQFSGKEGRSVSRQWAKAATQGGQILLILDESHNAVNKKSNTGKAIRTMIKQAGRDNVIYATATPMRDPSGADLYKPLLPKDKHGSVNAILEGVEKGGETAQECFTTMLAEDGVFLRRDHSLSNIEFLVRLPDDARIATYQNTMNQFAPLSELMLGAALKVGALVGSNYALHYERLLADGVDQRRARALTNVLHQHSAMASGPLANLARLTINTIKVEQIVNETMNELDEGRKPQITFHSTYGSLFSESVTNGSSNGTEIPLNFQDQVRRVAEQIFRIKFDGEPVDAREMDPNIAEANHEIQRRIDELPDDLPASPLDAVIEGLEANGLKVGEISGRSLAYRNGKIVRRNDLDRRKVVHDYNDGKIDVLMFNRAGATGGSYHASPDFKDQRPRSLIEMETPLDIIKYIQAQGRSNRFGQVARPRIVSVMTGLIPEMRILQQRNRKLRAMGASIDGNRSHPLLIDDVPDLLNKIGDLATRHVMRTNPDLARRLGFDDLVDDDAEENDTSTSAFTITDSGASSSTATLLANRALTRSLVLSAKEQTDLIDLIRIEFEAIVEELDSRNANPLKPKEMAGEIDIKSKMLFSGLQFNENDQREESAFSAPLYISTGTHHINEEPIDGDTLLQMVNTSMVTDGAEGFAPLANVVESLIPDALSHLVRPDDTIQQAIQMPDLQPYNFRRRFARLRRFAETLRNIKPGRVLQIDGADGAKDGRLRTIVKLLRPLDKHALLPQSYKLRTVTPGHGKAETVSVSQLLQIDHERLRFLPGLELGRNERHLRTFNQQLTVERRYPVQVLSGNLLDAIATARRHKLGTMSIYRETTGQIQRGIVITRKNVNFDYVPMGVPSVSFVKSILEWLQEGRLERNVSIFCRTSSRATEARRDEWLFDIYFYVPTAYRPAQFWLRRAAAFDDFLQSQSVKDISVFDVEDRLSDISQSSPELVRFLEHFERFVEDGSAMLRTNGRNRKLMTKLHEVLRQETASSDAQPPS